MRDYQPSEVTKVWSRAAIKEWATRNPLSSFSPVPSPVSVDSSNWPAPDRTLEIDPGSKKRPAEYHAANVRDFFLARDLHMLTRTNINNIRAARKEGLGLQGKFGAEDRIEQLEERVGELEEQIERQQATEAELRDEIQSLRTANINLLNDPAEYRRLRRGLPRPAATAPAAKKPRRIQKKKLAPKPVKPAKEPTRRSKRIAREQAE